MKRAANPEELTAPTNQNSTAIVTDTSNQKQRDAILKMLAHGSVNTLEFRAVGLCSPAPRIKELREAGWRIHSTRETATDSAGVKHHGIARYWLKLEGKQ
jgi:hypothetical protein